MPKAASSTPSKPKPKPKKPAKASAAGRPLAEPESRGARRKRETRGRLLEAALQLMAERGMEGVAINEITEAADVGVGSFYNHFASRESIYDDLRTWVFESYADALDQLLADVQDPAEVLSVSVRNTILRAGREPVWGRFLIREGLSPRVTTHGLGQRLMRDLMQGLSTRRFVVRDPVMSFVAVGGTILAAISAELQISMGGGQLADLRKLGLDTDSLPERTAATLLEMLGIEPAEAESISRRPLPLVKFPPRPA